MKGNASKLLVTVLAALAVMMVIAEPASAIWQALLDEHFNRNPRNNSWPWTTHPQRGWRWHYNPRNWPAPAEPNFSDNSWGWQDAIFNTHVTPNADFQGSIWCAYATADGPNEPQWPVGGDQYWHNVNAWTWWPCNTGFSTRDWEAGAVSYWRYIDLARYARDSLSVVLVDNRNLLTTNGNDFRTRVGIGKTYAIGTGQDWMYDRFYFDTVFVNGERTSFLDKQQVWLAFVWQSDNRDIAGTGAFIDDVMISWDDGLFDLFPVASFFGYRVNEDSINWSQRSPNRDDEILFRLMWRADGNGETPEFDVNLVINDEVFFSETRQVIAGTDTVYISETEEPWTVPSGEHIVRWELDPPLEEGGNVEESRENNNEMETSFTIEWNPPPMFELLTPAQDSVEFSRPPFRIEWTVSDSNEFDETFTIYLHWTKDTSGFSSNPDSCLEEWPYIWNTFRANIGLGSYEWDFTQDVAAGLIDSLDVLQIVGFATDGYPGNISYSVSPGTMIYVPPESASDSDGLAPYQAGLSRVFPNPFNRAVTIEYLTAGLSQVRLTVVDMTGREVARLLDRAMPAGRRVFTWTPQDIPAGVYLLRLDVDGRSFLRKAVYMP